MVDGLVFALALVSSLLSLDAFGWTLQSTFTIETGIELGYVLAAPRDPGSIAGKLPILIFEEGDGTADMVLNDAFAPPQEVAQLDQASAASGIVWAVPELRRQYFSGHALEICSLDFVHRERDLGRFIDQIKLLPFVDSAKIFLMGHSAGADTVTHVAAERGDIRGVINLAGGVSSCSEESADCPLNLPSLIQYQCSSDQDSGRTGSWWTQLFLQSNLFGSISSLTLPYLALIGDQDTVVSVAEFREYSARISLIRPSFQAVVLAGLDHGAIKTSPQAVQMILKFVNQNP